MTLEVQHPTPSGETGPAAGADVDGLLATRLRRRLPGPVLSDRTARLVLDAGPSDRLTIAL